MQKTEPRHGTTYRYSKFKCNCDRCYGAWNAWNKIRRDRTNALLADLKSKPCQDCGNTFPPECMDFDHRDYTTKINNVGQLAQGPKNKLHEEIAKCDLVCANCHRIRTKVRKQLNAGRPRKLFNKT